MDLFPESFREPGILILRPTPVEDTGRNPALGKNLLPVYQHDNLWPHSVAVTSLEAKEEVLS